MNQPVKLPWYIDLLNINLNNHDLDEARRRIELVMAKFQAGVRITLNLDFEGPRAPAMD
jgi:malate synthase